MEGDDRREGPEGRTFERRWEEDPPSNRDPGPAPTDATPGDEALNDLGWQDLIGRGFNVILTDRLLRMLKAASSMWDTRPAAVLSRALYIGLSALLGTAIERPGDAYVEEWFQSREDGAYGSLEGTWAPGEHGEGRPEGAREEEHREPAGPDVETKPFKELIS